MKKKILIALLVVVIAVIPTVIAVLSYTDAMKNPVSRSSVANVKVLTPGGNEFYYSKTDSTSDSELYSLLFDMNESMGEPVNLPGSTSDYRIYTAEYMSYNRPSTFTYYFSNSNDTNSVYCKDSNGQFFKISPESASGFMLSKYAAELFPDSDQSILTVAGTEVLPNSIYWKYRSHDNSFLDGEVTKSDEQPTVTVSGGLQLKFSTEPDYLAVTLTATDGTVVYEGQYEDIGADLFADNTVYNVKLQAKWYEINTRNYYGEGEYNYIANVLSPAVFYVSADSVTMGDFIVVSAKNIVDLKSVGFASEPMIYGGTTETTFKPVFFNYGGYAHALIPFSLATEEVNGKSGGTYKLVFSYGGVDQEFEIEVFARTIGKAYTNESLETLNTYNTEATKASFRSQLEETFFKESPDIYWMSDNMLVQPIDSSRGIKYGFGLTMIPNARMEDWYYHDGVNFKVKANDTVFACLPGVVTYVGETTLTGITVVVEHGAGLKSLYAHMSSTSVKVGDVLEKEDMIGIVGSTGFTEARTLHFGLYVFDTPVRYYTYEENGVCINSEIAKIIGIGNAGEAEDTNIE